MSVGFTSDLHLLLAYSLFSENVILAICSLFSVSVLMRSSASGICGREVLALLRVLCTSLASEIEQSLTTERENVVRDRATVSTDADGSLTTRLSVSGRWAAAASSRLQECMVTVKTDRRGLARRSCWRSAICSTDKRRGRLSANVDGLTEHRLKPRSRRPLRLNVNSARRDGGFYRRHGTLEHRAD